MLRRRDLLVLEEEAFVQNNQFAHTILCSDIYL